MDRSRYEGYVVARDAISTEPGDAFPAEVLCDLAEGVLLARDALEAEHARDRAAEELGLLVDGGELTRRLAGRFWIQLRACGPQMHWPPSWDRSEVAARRWAVRGH